MEILHVTRLLRENHYPNSFIKSCRRKPNYNSNNLTAQPHTAVLPYIQRGSETTSRIQHEYNANITHKPQSSLRAQLSKPKDHMNKLDRNDVISSIPCKDCETKYVGQTSKCLSTQLTELCQVTSFFLLATLLYRPDLWSAWDIVVICTQ